MIDILIPIMVYNDFVTNPVVTSGWAIIRDTVNMFFVVILLVIAFGTILGREKFKWQQQVPHLLIFAIVINFSKTLCGLMIDAGQVVMLSFANALREIAAGNFIQMLGLNQIYSMSASSDVLSNIESADAKGFSEAFGFVAAGVMSVLLTAWVFGTLIMLVAILIYRIIMLWVLVTLSPLAWFIGGASGVIESKAYSDWWDRFKCLVVVGPVLTFFLWLTLTVVGAGGMAAKSGFDVSAGSNNAGFLSVLLQADNFLSFLIGMAMMIAGFDAAQQFCQSMSGGFLGKQLQRARSGALQLTAAQLGLKAGSLVGRLGLKGAMKTPSLLSGIGRKFPGGAAIGRLLSKVPVLGKRSRAGIYGGIGKALGGTFLLGGVGRAFTAMAGDLKTKAGKQETARIDRAKGKMKDMTTETKADLGEQFANKGTLTIDSEAQATAILEEAMTDDKLAEQLRASGALEKLWKKYGKNLEEKSSYDPAKKKTVKNFKRNNADITGSVDSIEKWEDAQDLTEDALRDGKVQERLKKIKSKVKGKDGEFLNAYEAIEQGHAGIKKQDAISSSDGSMRYLNMGSEALNRVEVDEFDPDESGAGGASPEVLQKALVAAVEAGKTGRAEEIVQQMGSRYTNEKDPEKKKAMLTTMQSSINAHKDKREWKGIVKQLTSVHASADTQRRSRITELSDEENEKNGVVTSKKEDRDSKVLRDLSKDTELDSQLGIIKSEFDELKREIEKELEEESRKLIVMSSRSFHTGTEEFNKQKSKRDTLKKDLESIKTEMTSEGFDNKCKEDERYKKRKAEKKKQFEGKYDQEISDLQDELNKIKMEKEKLGGK